jgi:hypothetical protein
MNDMKLLLVITLVIGEADAFAGPLTSPSAEHGETEKF